ncbi:MAG: glycosyltransferase family 4 protein [Okeania sp. SIO2C2]|uniref:glycosyltransferase family 1 protein n=1 Tax=Okeania sp. SIO2C2 TaxID=2607787 RepID=UPI0013B70538|nr:glycosyltransferase family 1 protein [Okeania sp. SIO2C2]NEP89837.1 glycosyltransferase family 4 protein [Okeania sp. SIO2C2]
MKLMHNGLKDFLLLEEYIDSGKIGFLSLETSLPQWFINLTQSINNYSVGLQLRRQYRHLAMALRSFKFSDVDTIFIFEVYNQHLLFFMPLLAIMALRGKEVLIGLHGNQQFAITSKIKFLGLLYLKAYLNLFKKLKVVTFEVDDDVLPEKLRLPDKSKYIIPHPIISEAKPKFLPGERLPSNVPIKIGVVGMIRSEKPITEIIDKLQEYVKSSEYQCEFVIGTPFGQKPDYLDQLNVTLYDTTTQEEYIQILTEIDILVIHYEKDRYYYRTSGVISDAASCGCYIIASDYPVIKHQVNWPEKIGSTFSDFNKISNLIDEGIIHIREKGQDNHWLWREGRTAKAIAKVLFPNNYKLDTKVD